MVSRDDVAGNDFDGWEGRLDILDHLNLKLAIALTAVQDDNIKTSVHQLLQTDLVIGPGADCSGANELLGMWEFGGQRVVQVLEQV